MHWHPFAVRIDPGVEKRVKPIKKLIRVLKDLILCVRWIIKFNLNS
jgi:hypothetical protein